MTGPAQNQKLSRDAIYGPPRREGPPFQHFPHPSPCFLIPQYFRRSAAIVRWLDNWVQCIEIVRMWIIRGVMLLRSMPAVLKTRCFDGPVPNPNPNPKPSPY